MLNKFTNNLTVITLNNNMQHRDITAQLEHILLNKDFLITLTIINNNRT